MDDGLAMPSLSGFNKKGSGADQNALARLISTVPSHTRYSWLRRPSELACAVKLLGPVHICYVLESDRPFR